MPGKQAFPAPSEISVAAGPDDHRCPRAAPGGRSAGGGGTGRTILSCGRAATARSASASPSPPSRSGRRWRADAGSAAATSRGRRKRRSRACAPRSTDADRGSDRHGRGERGRRARARSVVGTGGQERRSGGRPARRAERRRARRSRRDGDDRGRRPWQLLRVPQMYMRKMAVGPVARGHIDLRRSVAENVQGDRRGIRSQPERRHRDRARPAAAPRPDRGATRLRARIKLIQDGDVTSAITAAIRGTNDHLASASAGRARPS